MTLNPGSGRLWIVGLGPAGPEWLTAQAQSALEQAQDIIGYAPYVARVPERVGQTRLRKRQSRGD